jgi:hypothetical protein
VDNNDSISCTWHGCYFAVAFFVLPAQFIFKLGNFVAGEMAERQWQTTIIPELAENVILRNLLSSKAGCPIFRWNRINLTSN